MLEVCIGQVQSLYRAGSLVTVSKELTKYRLNLVGVQEVRWEGGGTDPAGEYTFFYGKENENHELGTGFFCAQKNHISFYEELESVFNKFPKYDMKILLGDFHAKVGRETHF
jgi:hypothetical protein